MEEPQPGIDMCDLHYDPFTGDIEEGLDRSGHFWWGCPPKFEPAGARGGFYSQ